MKTTRIIRRAFVVLALFAGLPFDPNSVLVPGLVSEAQALDVAGVARRTAVRKTAVAATTAVAAAAAQPKAAPAEPQASPAQPQAAAEPQVAPAQPQAAVTQQPQAAPAQQTTTAAALPPGTPGTIVNALPSGCTTLSLSGVDYFNCNGTYYRAAFQSGNVVYVVSTP